MRMRHFSLDVPGRFVPLVSPARARLSHPGSQLHMERVEHRHKLGVLVIRE